MDEAYIEEWIINWFEKNASISREAIMAKADKNYLLEGWIDSFQFIEFLSDIEKKFEVSFSNDEFQNRDFGEIKGIVKIIMRKKHG